MITIAEHTIDLSIIPEGGSILDIGCLGFTFKNALEAMGYKVYAVDIQDLQVDCYYRCAIAGFTGLVGIIPSKDRQAYRIGYRMGHTLVDCYTLKDFMTKVKVPFFDAIKMDIEGTEYEVIMSLTEPPATQLSIEFHLHTKVYGDAQVKEMEDKLLSLGYFPAKHDKFPAHGLPPNYWDSLFILQK